MATSRTHQVAVDILNLLNAWQRARWWWQRRAIEHAMFVKVSHHREIIINTLRGLE